MKKRLLSLSLPFLILYIHATAVVAQHPPSPQISDAWIREAAAESLPQAAYMVIRNPTARPITLRSVRSPDFSRIEMHKSEIREGMAHMKRQHRIVIPANGSLVMEPGGYHLMLFHPRQKLQEGDIVRMRFMFGSMQYVYVMLPVKKFAPATP